MKRTLQTLAILALVPAAVLISSTQVKAQDSAATGVKADEPKAEPAEPKGKASVMVAVQPGQPGGVVVQTYQQTADVTHVNKEKREITLSTPEGKMTVKCGPDVVNFDQINVGDQVKATLINQLTIFVRKAGEPAAGGEKNTVALAPVGAKPGGIVVNTVETTAKVTAVDLEQHKATLQFPDGQSKTFQVRKDVDLSDADVGKEVVIRSTEAIALRVEKP